MKKEELKIKLEAKLKIYVENMKKCLKFSKKKINIYMTEVSEKIPNAETSYGNDWEAGTKPKRFLHLILWSILGFMIIFVIWAKFAMLDEVTHAEGKVIPSRQIQIIQNLEGGIVENIFVKEGQVVQKGQVLMQFDTTRFASSHQEGLAKEAALELKIQRLTAEIDNKPFEPVGKDDSILRQEKALYVSRQNQLRQLQESHQLAQKEVEMTAPLVKQGAASEVEVLRLKRSVNEIQEQIDRFNSDTLNELTTAKADLAALKESNLANKDRLARTTIPSPVRGIVKQIKLNTVGGVAQPGMELMEIVPLDDSLLIEAKVKPSDVGFLQLGLPATVKITAFDYSIYGGLKGKVEQISADSIIDEKDQRQQSYYLIRVRTDKNYIGSAQKPLYIIPGMTATVDILTGRKSVLHYILKPLIKAKERAFTER